MTAGCLLALPDDLLDLLADSLKGNAQAFQRLGSHAFTLVDEAEQDVLGANVVVVEHAGFFLGQHDNAPCSVGKPLKHLYLPTVAASWPYSSVHEYDACAARARSRYRC